MHVGRHRLRDAGNAVPAAPAHRGTVPIFWPQSLESLHVMHGCIEVHTLSPFILQPPEVTACVLAPGWGWRTTAALRKPQGWKLGRCSVRRGKRAWCKGLRHEGGWGQAGARTAREEGSRGRQGWSGRPQGAARKRPVRAGRLGLQVWVRPGHASRMSFMPSAELRGSENAALCTCRAGGIPSCLGAAVKERIIFLRGKRARFHSLLAQHILQV